MISAGLGLSTRVAPGEAAREAVRMALAGSGADSIDVALVFGTTAWGPQLGEVVAEAGAALDAGIVVGASVAGLFAAEGAGAASNPGVAVLALSGVRSEGLLLSGLAGAERGAAKELLEHLREPPGPNDVALFFTDGGGLVPEAVFVGAEAILGECKAFGLGASAPLGAGASVWCDGRPEESALAGLVLRGVGPARSGVATAGRVLTGPMTVTRSRDHQIKSLDGRRATEVFEEVAMSCGINDSRQARTHFVVSIEEASGISNGDPGEVELRQVVGMDPRRGSISLPVSVPVGSRLSFILEDEVGARENLEALVDIHSGRAPLFGLYLEPESSARQIPGDFGATARCLDAGFPGVPILGLRGAFPLANPGSPNVVCRPLNHRSVLVLIDP